MIKSGMLAHTCNPRAGGAKAGGCSETNGPASLPCMGSLGSSDPVITIKAHSACLTQHRQPPAPQPHAHKPAHTRMLTGTHICTE